MKLSTTSALTLLPLLGLAALGAGCPPGGDTGQEPAKAVDTGPPRAVAAPMPDPGTELAALVQRAERALSAQDGSQYQELDRLLYTKGQTVNPAHPAVDRANRVRARMKEELVPYYMGLAETSFKAGRYDDAFRQAAYVKDSHGADLVRRRDKILKKKPGILRKREVCAKKWTLRACKLNEQHPDWPLKTCKSLYEEMIGLGMTPEMVRISWGEPKRVERSVDKKGNVQVMWVYDKGAAVVFDGPNDDDLELTEVNN